MQTLGHPPAGVPPSPTRRWLRALERTAVLERPDAPTLPDLIDAQAARCGSAPALLSDAESFDYATLAARSNRYSRWALSQDLGPGRTVGLMMPNRPEYLAAWFGITRVGATVALLNTNLRGASLAHCVAAVTPRGVIVDPACREAFATALPFLAAPVRVWSHADLDAALARLPGDVLEPSKRPAVDPASRALCIYTSGTTGLPKAANVSHRRIMTWSLFFAGLADINAADRMYDCLPLYHSVGGVVAPGCVLASGGAVVIRERFSASLFWDDVARWDCTLFQYIGELCRFLVNAPPGTNPRHRLRLCLGNGLRPDVWTAFTERFSIPEIMEFYAATEGSFSLVNIEGRAGSIGRVPPFLAHRFPIAILRHDVETGQPLRDARGLCIEAAPGEAGEAVGLLGDGTAKPAGRFEGYTHEAANEAKILRDVFAPGDRWFRTGDLMRVDTAGFHYFVDRIGDTFRWKGENVSASEVAEVLMGAPGVAEAAVYGVTVPGQDGRAGMAAIVTTAGFALPALRLHLEARLPPYARPLFLRLLERIESTDTHKQKKAPLIADGFDPTRIADPLFLDDRLAEAYLPLDAGRFAHIVSGAARL